MKWSCALQSRVDGHLILDPTMDEAYREDGSALLAMMPSANAVSFRHLCTPITSFAQHTILRNFIGMQINFLFQGLHYN